MSLKEYYSNHIAVLDRVSKLRHSRANREYNLNVARVSGVDSILEFEKFKKEVQPFLNRTKLQVNIGFAPQAYFYGYYQEIVRFADMEEKLPGFPVFSHMEHGAANIDTQRDEFSANSSCYCSCSDYRRTDIHEIAPKRMYISTGPYIHYSKKYYSEADEKKIKKEWGRTLLVFPFHRCEGEENGKGEENVLFDAVYSTFKKKFDSIIVCTYWFDVNDAILDRYKNEGAKIVSSGFRGDGRFVQRLKTLISLSDACIMDEVGTNLGFCYYMGKPTYLIERESRFDDKLFEENTKRFGKAFGTDDLFFSDEQKNLQKTLYDYYWGGECIRSKKEIKAILTNVSRILKIAGYDMNGKMMDRATDSYRNRLLKENTDGSKYLYEVLEQTLR